AAPDGAAPSPGPKGAAAAEDGRAAGRRVAQQADLIEGDRAVGHEDPAAGRGAAVAVSEAEPREPVAALGLVVLEDDVGQLDRAAVHGQPAAAGVAAVAGVAGLAGGGAAAAHAARAAPGAPRALARPRRRRRRVA